MDNIEYGKILINYMFNNIYNNVNQRLKLNKKKRNIGIINKMSPEVRLGAYDISMFLNFGEYNDIVSEFKFILDTKLSHCNNNAFYKNIQSLLFKEYTNQQSNASRKMGGEYVPKLNIIRTYKANITEKFGNSYEESRRRIIMHELLHMASTYKKGVIEQIGFSQGIRNQRICMELTEGYTELLNCRYFCNGIHQDDIYATEQILALGIEEIVGRQEMEKLYFAADLKGLIDRLSHWMDNSKIIEILNDITRCSRKRLVNKVEYIEDFGKTRTKIANVLLNKYNQLFKEGKIDQEEYDYQRLKTAFYVKGFILEKKDETYTVSTMNHQEKTLTKDGYRLIKNHYLESTEVKNKYAANDYQRTLNDIVKYAEIVHKAETKDCIDLSNVERLDLSIKPSERGYKITTKDGTRETIKFKTPSAISYTQKDNQRFIFANVNHQEEASSHDELTSMLSPQNNPEKESKNTTK